VNAREIDWKALDRLRAAFLNGSAGERDYWQSEADVASYDQTFAQRIGWKWDYVLAELKRRGWSPPGGELLDWGCGSGIAGRAFLGHFGVQCVSELSLWDRSPLALRFAERKAREKFPSLAVRVWDGGRLELARPEPTPSPLPGGELGTGVPNEAPFLGGAGGGFTAGARVLLNSVVPPESAGERSQEKCDPPLTLLLSHVLTELNPAQLEQLLALAGRATAILWVEPGTHGASRAIIAVRERLRSQFNVVAPCTHQAACGMLASENSRHWCHHFAPPPAWIFTDGEWMRFANLAGIDLRSLPLSFLALDRRAPVPLPSGAVRLIGRPRVHKGHAQVFACDASGVCDRRLTKRTLPDAFSRLKKGNIDPLQIWVREGNEIVAAQPVIPASTE
jgi:hypothetical protein